MANPHRGDTEVEVAGEKYTLCYDLNAAAKVMERLGFKSFSDMQQDVTFDDSGLEDLLYILWCGFNRHHPEVTLQDVGGMDWDLDIISDKIGEAFERGFVRKSSPPDEGGQKQAEQSDPPNPGTGSEYKSPPMKQD